jgi:hypothetical protein
MECWSGRRQLARETIALIVSQYEIGETECQTVGLREEDAELLDSRTLGKLSSYIDLPTRLG